MYTSHKKIWYVRSIKFERLGDHLGEIVTVSVQKTLLDATSFYDVMTPFYSKGLFSVAKTLAASFNSLVFEGTFIIFALYFSLIFP